LLWSDPTEDFGPNLSDNGYEYNKIRGCSFSYSYEAVCDFLEDNNLLSMIRAHEVQDHGFAMLRKVEKTGFPSVITLFSAPNYCESYKNKAAIMRYENNVINIRQFNHTNPPYYLPSFMNVFSWSLPFVAEKVGEILVAFYKLVDDDKELEELKIKETLQQKQAKLREKIKSVSKAYNIYQNMRRQREKSIQVGHIIRKGGALSETVSNLSDEDLKKSLETFEGVKNIDMPLEVRPPQEKDYIPKSTRPMLQRKVSLEQIINEEPKKPTPLINMENN